MERFFKLQTYLIALSLLGFASQLRPATASPATASPATASPATASPATASPATARPATATVIEERKLELIEHAPTEPGKAKINLQFDVKDGLPHQPQFGDLHLPPELIQKLDAEELASIVRLQLKKPEGLAEIVFNEEILVPTVVFSTIAAIAFMLIYFSYRKRRDYIETVRIAIQSGQTLPPSFIEGFEKKSQVSPDSDLRRAVLLITLGLSGTIVLAAMGGKELGRAWAIGIVPSLLGLGYLFLWRQSQKKLRAGSNDAER